MQANRIKTMKIHTIQLKNIIATSVGALILMIIPFWNGSPFFFDDSGTYLLTAIKALETGWLSIPWSRSPFYSFFLYIFHLKISLWPIVFAQSIIVSHLIYVLYRVILGHTALLYYFLLVLILTLTTSLPWLTAQLTPDFFTSIVILGAFLLGFCRKQLSCYENIYFTSLLFLSIIVHFSHLAIAIALIPLIIFIRRIANFNDQEYKLKEDLLLLTPLLLAFFCSIAIQKLSRDETSIAPHAQIFILARLLADGPSKKYLDESCIDKKYLLCDHINVLDRHSNWFLWEKESPLYLIGVNQLKEEANEIIVNTIKQYPAWCLQISFNNFLRQLYFFDTATWLKSFSSDTHSAQNAVKTYFPNDYDKYFIDSKQNRSELPINLIKYSHRVVITISILCSILLLIKHYEIINTYFIMLLSIIITGLLFNAFICGVLSIVTDRYQSRVIWLIVLFAFLISYHCLSLKKTDKNQT